jgi:8-oxo-dGTP pyrophosphatase MutT (NUDIX family)
MSNPELLLENEQKVSRSFLMTLANADDIYNFFIINPDAQEFSFLRFVLARKDSKDKGGPRLTFFGGKIKDNENPIEAAQREVIEELGLSLIGIGRSIKESVTTFHDLGNYSYTFGEFSRNAIINGFYVDPTIIGDHLIGDKRIKNYVVVSLEELEKLINGEQIKDLSLEEHLRIDKNSDGDFRISDGDFEQRKNIFERVISWFKHIDQYLKRRFQKIFDENPNITQEEFKIKYQQEVIRFMRLGLERSLEKKGKREKEATEEDAEIIKRGLNEGFLGTDVLYFLPKIAGIIAEGKDPKIILSESTETFYQYFRGLYDDFLKEQGLRRDGGLEEVHEFINRFNGYILERIKEDFGISDKEIELTFSHFNGFWSELEQDLKVADPELTKGLVQNYRLLNEVMNASFGRLVLLFLGLDNAVDETGGDTKKQSVFEAGRQLLLLMKGFLSVRYFEERSKPESTQKVNIAVENFFGFPSGEKIEITSQKGFSIIVEKRIGENSGNKGFIVDEKPGKRWISFVRKSFKERPEDIIDFSSFSIVYLEEDKREFIQELLDGTFERKFLDFIKNQFPKSKVKLERKNTFGLKNYAENDKNNKGKRTGSQAKRIIAQKYVLHIDDQVAEVVIYPFLSTKENNIDDNGWWLGWLEKREDDSDYVVRRMLAGENGIPSFYDLLFPTEIYPELYKYRLHATYHL